MENPDFSTPQQPGEAVLDLMTDPKRIGLGKETLKIIMLDDPELDSFTRASQLSAEIQQRERRVGPDFATLIAINAFYRLGREYNS